MPKIIPRKHIRDIALFNNGGVQVPVCARVVGSGRSFQFTNSSETSDCQRCLRYFPMLYPWAAAVVKIKEVANTLPNRKRK